MLRKMVRRGAIASGAFVRRVENNPLSVGTFFAAFTTIIVVRMVEQQWLDGFPSYGISGQFYEFAQTFLFFLFSFTIFLVFLHRFAQIPFARAANVLLVGFLVILLPPIVDTLQFDTFWSYYEFAGLRDLLHAFWTVFGDTPNIGVTNGDRIEIVLSVFAMGFYAYLNTHNKWRSIFIGSGTYVVLFFLASLPSWIAIGAYGWRQGFLSIGPAHVAQMFLSPNPLLARQIDSVNIILHVHMSIIYALTMIFLGSGMVWWYNKVLWQSVRRIITWRQVLATEGFFLGGIGAVMIFGFQSASVFATSMFAVPAFLLVVLSVALLVVAVACIDALHTATGRQLSNLRILAGVTTIGALLGVFIVSGRAGTYALAFVAVMLIGAFAPLRFLVASPLRYGIAAVRYVLVYLLGIALVTATEIPALTGGRMLVYVGILALGVALTVDCRIYARRWRVYMLALYWFFVSITTLLLLNLFAYKLWIIGIGTVVAGLLYNRGRRMVR